jgi:ketosteroid isomerase-like protein
MATALILLAFLATAFVAPTAVADDDADFRKAAPQIRLAFLEAFAKQDVAWLAASYTSDAVNVTPMGAHPINAKSIEGWFADGSRTIETTFDQALPISADIALGIGTFRVTGKTLKNEPVEVTARWANTYVRQDGRWKIRMATVIPQPPPAK